MKNKTLRHVQLLFAMLLCCLLVACAANTTPANTTTEQPQKVTKPEAKPVQIPTKKTTPRKSTPSKVSQQNNTHDRRMASLNGHKTTNSRVLAAGGYITGALGGS